MILRSIRNRRHILLILLCVSGLLCIRSGYVYAMASVSVINEFETGIVDISLEEYQRSGQKERLWEDDPVILPGDKVSKIPRISNHGNECFVRAKLTFRDTDDLSDHDFYGMDADWIKCSDGYYYYTKSLRPNDHIDIFQGIDIPVDFPQEDEGSSFYLDINVDAIQSKNFTPDYEASAPWGNVEILTCEKEGQYDIRTFKQSDTQSFRIIYQGNAGKLITNREDFFVNFPYLMPGDEYADSARLINDGKEDINLYFRSEAFDDSELLEKIRLAIDCTIDGKTSRIYEGNLRAEELKDHQLLGTIPAGSEGVFSFTVYVPAWMNNKYTILDSYVKWIFSTDPIKDTTAAPKTGDSTNALYVFAAGAALGIIAVCGLIRNGRRRGLISIRKKNRMISIRKKNSLLCARKKKCMISMGKENGNE